MPRVLLGDLNVYYEVYGEGERIRCTPPGSYHRKRLFPDPGQQELRDLLIDHYSQNDAHAYLATLDALAVWSVVSRLGDLHMLTLFITADHDYTSMQDKKRYVDQFSNARMVVVENSRHGTPLDQPEVFNSHVLDFLSSMQF